MAYQGKTKRSRMVTVVAVTVAVVALTGAQKSCQTSTRNGSSSKVQSTVESTADSKGNRSVVVYSVTSDAEIKSITFLDSKGRKVTRTNVGSSWSGSGPSEHGTVLVSATTGEGSSMIKCSVTVHGKVVQRASAVGDGSTTVVCRTSY